MAENYSKSKLKRKKSSVEELQDKSTKGTPKREYSKTFSDNTAETTRSAAWWSRDHMPAVESLWMWTLKSALPYLEQERWDLVPELPHPSAVKPTAQQLEEQRWCDLNYEVLPFPEPTLPPPKSSTSSDPFEPCSSQHDLPIQTSPVPEPPDRQHSPHSRQSQDDRTTTTSRQSLTKKKQPFFHQQWEEVGSSAASLNVGREEGGTQEKQQTGAVNKQRCVNKMKISDNRVFVQKKGEQKVAVDRAAEGVEGSSTGDGEAATKGEGGLQSCPMCLMVFPNGFTQMDCDGHLAQCLSEMNVDMNW